MPWLSGRDSAGSSAGSALTRYVILGRLLNLSELPVAPWLAVVSMKGFGPLRALNEQDPF